MRQPVDIDEFQKYLIIDKNSLDEELEKQPILLFEICRATSEAISLRDSEKQRLEVIDASINEDLRQEAFRTNTKITEAKLAAAVLLDHRHTQTYADYSEARKEADLWIALKEAFIQKGFALRELVELYLSGYFATSSVKERITKEDLEIKSMRTTLNQNRKLVKKE